MIDLSQDVLLSLLLRALLSGAVLGGFYDCIRALKMLLGVRYGNEISQNALSIGRRVLVFCVTFFFDLVFWLAAALISVMLIYHVGGGIFRGMAYLGMAIGFTVYYFTLGRLVLYINERVTDLIKKTLRWAARLALIPIRALGRGIFFLYLLTIGKFIGKIKERMAIAKARRKEVKGEEDGVSSENEDACGKEEFVYVDGKTGYRKEGRIRFG